MGLNILNYALSKKQISEIETEIEGASFVTAEVTELPTENISSGTIYVVHTQDEQKNDISEEYIYLKGRWEKLGNPTTAATIATTVVQDSFEEQEITEEEVRKMFEDASE